MDSGSRSRYLKKPNPKISSRQNNEVKHHADRQSELKIELRCLTNVNL